jgi:hypothetical protein
VGPQLAVPTKPAKPANDLLFPQPALVANDGAFATDLTATLLCADAAAYAHGLVDRWQKPKSARQKRGGVTKKECENATVIKCGSSAAMASASSTTTPTECRPSREVLLAASKFAAERKLPRRTRNLIVLSLFHGYHKSVEDALANTDTIELIELPTSRDHVGVRRALVRFTAADVDKHRVGRTVQGWSRRDAIRPSSA